MVKSKNKSKNKSKTKPNKQAAANSTATAETKEDLDQLQWLKECDIRRDADGEPFLQLEYSPDHELYQLLQRFLEESAATSEMIQLLYQIWQQTVLSTLLASSGLWKQPNVTSADQRVLKDQLKQARYKVQFILHHVIGSMLTSPDPKWKDRHDDLLQFCFQTLSLLPRLAESCPHSKTDIRATIIHFEGKEFLATVACETWDTLYDYSISLEQYPQFVPVLRKCAMLDILDKDWNMLGGWDDILKGLEAKCCLQPIARLPSDAVLQEQTTILRNARNSMQCKFFSVRFMRYTQDQAPQRWRYFPKCSAPACSNIETPDKPHPHRCTKCWYFHYCSAACQDYCDNIMGLHPKFCRDTPTAKAALCQQETCTYLQWNTSSTLTCRACGLSETHVTDPMKRCSNCQNVVYCSRQCQEWDWRIGGHKKQCSKNNSNSTTTPAFGEAPTKSNGTSNKPAGSVEDVVKELN